MSSALHEATEINRGAARYYNTDLTEYLIPVNADIDDVKVIMVNELGIKGLGELGDVGTNAAVVNAVHHSTGVRIRELPLRPESCSRPRPAPPRPGSGQAAYSAAIEDSSPSSAPIRLLLRSASLWPSSFRSSFDFLTFGNSSFCSSLM